MNLIDIQKFESARHNRHINKMKTQLESYSLDVCKELRKSECKCKYCYYIETGVISMSVMTKSNCASCGKSMMFASSNVDVLCEDCAKKFNLCKHCGVDIMEGC